jgi:hypothetical protein
MNVLSNRKSVTPKDESAYDRSYALEYWRSLAINDAIHQLSYEMFDALGHIKISVNVLTSDSGEDTVRLLETKTPFGPLKKALLESYKAISDMTSILYVYQRNRRKNVKEIRKELSQERSLGKIEFPENIAIDYLELLPDWYQQKPGDFLATVIPLFEEHISDLGNILGVFSDEAGWKDILLGSGKLTFSVEVVVREMTRGHSYLSEDLFLLKACANFPNENHAGD